MSILTPRRRIEARIRRIASLVLSVACAVALVANIVIFVVRPSTFLSDGTFGLSPVPAFLVDSLGWTPVAGIAAVLLVGTMPAAASVSPPVDRLPKRLPMIAAVAALCLAVAGIAVLDVISLTPLFLMLFFSVF